MDFYKKTMIFLISVIVLGSGHLLYNKLKKEPIQSDSTPTPNHSIGWRIQSIKEFKPDPKKVPEKERKALQESLHEGTAFFADLYRIELAVIKQQSRCLYLLFIDNYLAQPTFPGRTDLNLMVGDKKIKLTPMAPATLLNYDKCPNSLPSLVSIEGSLRGLKFKHKVEVKKYRTKPFSFEKIKN